mmetsp:Transcript_48015/g.145049  ORF Transcript_48015/g.145049 Transcript_48015/m.145049 type:complete len:90 (-) Transcript_48015:405-674(-)
MICFWVIVQNCKEEEKGRIRSIFERRRRWINRGEEGQPMSDRTWTPVPLLQAPLTISQPYRRDCPVRMQNLNRKRLGIISPPLLQKVYS